MSRPIRAADYAEHFDPELAHHRAWLQAVLERLVALEPQALEEGGTLRRLWTARKAANGAAPAPMADLSAAVAVALPLVKEFEGCRLDAYPDPETGGEPWTIGWGSTSYVDGALVRQDDQISQELADALLEGRLARDWGLLVKLVPGWRQFNVNQQAALLSFTYNCGPAWFGGEGFSTLTNRLCHGEQDKVPAALMLYVNPGGPSEAGLRRRRKAEAALWSAAPGNRPVTAGSAFGAPAATTARSPSPKPSGESSAEPAPSSKGNPLPVPWFAQLDSATDQARRMCFSSSCAMLLAFLKPGVLTGPNGDDQYLARVQQFGDTTDPAAQIKALASYSITARYSKQASFSTLEQQIAAGIPVPCGYLHRGPVSSPAGGGHWLIAVGITPTNLIVHDPLGEADLVNGTTLGGIARFCRYSRRNFAKRWMVEGDGTGWAVVVDAIR
jgi:GH24 family phage-related lysozyme (muramidase)